MDTKSHQLFIASIVRNEIQQHIKELLEKDRKNFTVISIIRELEKITVVRNANKEYVRRYALTSKQKKILSQFDLMEKDLNELVAEYNKRLVTHY